MLNKKTVLCLLAALLYLFLSCGAPANSAEPVETIFYNISPVGTSIYEDLGIVELRGKPARKVIFKTEVGGFNDTEIIYSDPDTWYPYRVERDIAMWLHKENIIEEYNLRENRGTITKFEKGKKTAEYLLQAKGGPIHSAILLPFSLRSVSNLKIGWSCKIRLPDEYKVTLCSIEEVTVPAGKFKAYHFTSVPEKFEIWISADSLRLPVKIKGVGGIPYALVMQKRTAGIRK